MFSPFFLYSSGLPFFSCVLSICLLTVNIGPGLPCFPCMHFQRLSVFSLRRRKAFFRLKSRCLGRLRSRFPYFFPGFLSAVVCLDSSPFLCSRLLGTFHRDGVNSIVYWALARISACFCSLTLPCRTYKK